MKTWRAPAARLLTFRKRIYETIEQLQNDLDEWIDRYNEMPVFLLTMFAKNEKEDLTKAERNALAKVARALRESYGE